MAAYTLKTSTRVTEAGGQTGRQVFCFETGLTMYPWLAWNSLCIPSRSQTDDVRIIYPCVHILSLARTDTDKPEQLSYREQ